MSEYKKTAIIAVLLACSILPLNNIPVSFAETDTSAAVSESSGEEVVSGDYTYQKSDENYVIITKCTSKDDTISIPSAIDGLTVGEIGKSAFSSLKAQKIIIPETIQYISSETPFVGCYSLKEIEVSEKNENYCVKDGILFSKDMTKVLFCPPASEIKEVILPETVTSLSKNCFSNCKNITLADLSNTALTTIPERCFLNCSSLEKAKLPDSIKTLGDEAFMGTALKKIKLASVENLGEKCAGFDAEGTVLDEFTIGGKYDSPASEYADTHGFDFVVSEEYDDIEAYEDMETFTSDEYMYTLDDEGNAEIVHCFSGMETIDVPEEIDGHKVTSIYKLAFTKSEAVTIRLPDTVETIGTNAFSFCNYLQHLKISGNCKLIEGDSLFVSCQSLTDITVGEGDGNYCSVDGVLYSKDMSELAAYPISKPDENFTAPEGLKIIDHAAFCKNKFIKSADLTGVETIGKYSFAECTALETVKFSDSFSTVDECAFYGCTSLKKVRIGKSLETIGDYAFGFYYNEKYVGEYADENADLPYYDADNVEETDEVVDGFTIYTEKDSTISKYSKVNNIKVVYGTVDIGGKNVDIKFLYAAGGVVIAIILGIAGIFTAKAAKRKKEEKLKAKRKAAAKEKLSGKE